MPSGFRQRERRAPPARPCGPGHLTGARGRREAQNLVASIAITGSIFYSQLASTHGDFALAFQHGIISIAAFAVAALALVLADSAIRARPTEAA
jgi:hypothetical protein